VAAVVATLVAGGIAMRRYSAEAIGTFGVVFTGCGAALIGGPKLGDPGVALAFGLALAAMLFAAGPISGGHFNPAVTAAMAVTRRLAWRDVPGYIAAQLGGGVLGAAAAITMAEGRPGGAPRAAESIANGYGRLSPGYYGLGSALIAEVALTALFVFVYLGVTPPARVAGATTPQPGAALLPLAAGLAYTLIHLVGFQVTRVAANPARALGPALLAGGLPLTQVWLFVVAPIAGGLLAAAAHRLLHPAPLPAKAVDVGASR
jgi:aquaporin Z